MKQVELHVHLDGSFDPSLLLSHLKETGHDCLPQETFCPWDQTTVPVRSAVEACENDEAFQSLCTCRGQRSLHSMLKCFTIFIPIVRGNLDLIERLAHDFVQRQALQNVIYTEVRYSPHLLAKEGDVSGTVRVDPIPVIDAVTRGLRRGEKEYGVKVNQIFCCIAWRPDWAKEVIELAHDRREDSPCAVVGVDVAAGEEHFDKVSLRFMMIMIVHVCNRINEILASWTSLTCNFFSIAIHPGRIPSFTRPSLRSFSSCTRTESKHHHPCWGGR